MHTGNGNVELNVFLCRIMICNGGVMVKDGRRCSARRARRILGLKPPQKLKLNGFNSLYRRDRPGDNHGEACVYVKASIILNIEQI